MYLYSVKDLKSGIYAAPFVSENNETATRALQTTLFTSSDSLLKLYPDDYVLYNIGSFNNETGIILDSEHVRVVCCAELINNYKQDSEEKVVNIKKKDKVKK